jgi:hypothetical protein
MANGPRRPSLVRQTTEPPVDYGNLTDEQIINMLSSSETREYGGMPLGPGSVLNVLRLGKNLPNILRRFRGLFKANPQSTAPSNTLRDVVLSDKPANVSRRGFFTNPIQTAVDIPQALREIGISERSIRSGDEVGNWPEPGSMLDTLDWNATSWEDSYDPETGTDAADRLRELINDKLVPAGYRSGSSSNPSGVIRDIETMMRIYGDQVLKESAEKAGRSLEEELEVQRKELSKPGVVSKAVESVRRRYGR